jgi:hypothetical protein
LFSSSCTNYAEAYKNKLFNDSCQANPQINSQCPGYKQTTNTLAVTSVNESVQSVTEVALVTDPIINQNLSTTTSITSQTNPISPTSTISNQPQLGTGLTVPGLSIPGVLQPSRSRTSAGTVREQSRREALNTASRAENQVKDNQARQQESIINSMGTIPGFDAYQSASIPDAVFYKTRDIYRNVTLSDNRRAQRALSERSDRIHQEMVNSQYNLAK